MGLLCLASFTSLFSRFTHVVARVMLHSFSMADTPSYGWTTFVHLLMHRGCPCP